MTLWQLLTHLHLDYTRVRRGLTMYLENRWSNKLGIFQNHQKRIKEKGRTWDHQVYVQLWWTKEAKKQLSFDTIKIHPSRFDCDIDSSSDSPTTVVQGVSMGPEAVLQPAF